MTYSIIARDPATGELGAAVQSHWFSVGAMCTWARPGVGVAATQAVIEPAYGPRALDRLAAGEGADAALDALLAGDDVREVRQVAVLGATGAPAVHTGAECLSEARDATGPDWSCQANMMRSATVPEAMSAAFAGAQGDLAGRLVAALRAAEGEGGDVRGRQSAALLVVPASGEPWETTVDLRVEDHPEPLDELDRLVGLRRAYALAGEGDDLLAGGDALGAGERFRAAFALAPEKQELGFWAGLCTAYAGDVEAGAAAVRRAAETNPGWLVLLDRLTPEFAPGVDEVRQALSR